MYTTHYLSTFYPYPSYYSPPFLSFTLLSFLLIIHTTPLPSNHSHYSPPFLSFTLPPSLLTFSHLIFLIIFFPSLATAWCTAGAGISSLLKSGRRRDKCKMNGRTEKQLLMEVCHQNVFVCSCVDLRDCLSVWLSICLFVCLFVSYTVCLFACISVCLSVCQSVCLSVYLSVPLTYQSVAQVELLFKTEAPSIFNATHTVSQLFQFYFIRFYLLSLIFLSFSLSFHFHFTFSKAHKI